MISEKIPACLEADERCVTQSVQLVHTERKPISIPNILELIDKELENRANEITSWMNTVQHVNQDCRDANECMRMWKFRNESREKEIEECYALFDELRPNDGPIPALKVLIETLKDLWLKDRAAIEACEVVMTEKFGEQDTSVALAWRLKKAKFEVVEVKPASQPVEFEEAPNLGGTWTLGEDPSLAAAHKKLHIGPDSKVHGIE